MRTAAPAHLLAHRLHVGMLCLACSLAYGRIAHADEQRLPLRAAKLSVEDAKSSRLTITVAFRDVIDEEIQTKLTRGLPTTILFAAGVYVPGKEAAVGTTIQSCRITWHVWEEAYRVELVRANLAPVTSWTATLEGVLRRCGETRRLPLAWSATPQLAPAYVVRARVLVNPIGDALMQKIKRWVSRPTGMNTSGPGDTLFGTFTGFFMHHVGEAERIVVFGTAPIVPVSEPAGEDKT